MVQLYYFNNILVFKIENNKLNYMKSFISLFKEMYYKNEKNINDITNESVHDELITLL